MRNFNERKNPSEYLGNALPIWSARCSEINSYARFKDSFFVKDRNKKFAAISADGVINVYLNGQLAVFGQFCDSEKRKFITLKEITPYIKDGLNEIIVDVWHYGITNNGYIAGKAFVAFAVFGDNNEYDLCSSGDTLSSPVYGYKTDELLTVNKAIGLSFRYDAESRDYEYEKSEVVKINAEYADIREFNLVIEERQPFSVIKTKRGYLFDFFVEQCGFPELAFSTDKRLHLKIVYGERLVNGVIPYSDSGGNYSFYYYSKVGKNEYINKFRRIAGRYVEVITDDEINIEYIGFRPVKYAFKEKSVTPIDGYEEIFEVCKRTLYACIHEQFEDCPLREQTMYVIDFYLQSEACYVLFDNDDKIRENLKSFAQNADDNGFIKCIYPCEVNFVIPFFSLYFVIAVARYYEVTRDLQAIKELFSAAERTVKAFVSKIDEKGLIPDFVYPYWNFYEWNINDGNFQDFSKRKAVKSVSLVLNSAFLLCVKKFKTICEAVGKKFDFDEKEYGNRIKKYFYDENGDLYRLSDTENRDCSLSNALLILSDAANDSEKQKLCERIKADDLKNNCSISSLLIVFDALYYANKDNLGFIRQKIKQIYQTMIDDGATTFYENVQGAELNGGSGSLCHGWGCGIVKYIVKS